MTPSLCTSTPLLARPATTAASRNSPETRGSRPTTATGRPSRPSRPPRTVAAATLRSRASCAVNSRPATPRTPSVPNKRLRCPASAISLRCSVGTSRAGAGRALKAAGPAEQRGLPEKLPLGVLRRLPGLLQTVLLALLDPGVPGQETRSLQGNPVLGVNQRQSTCDPQPQCACLAGDPTAGDEGHHVELLLGPEGHERLVDEL